MQGLATWQVLTVATVALTTFARGRIPSGLACAYIAANMYRTICPVVYWSGTCGWCGSPIGNRLAATVGEVAFVVQLAHHFCPSKDVRNRLVAIAVLAEVLCWTGVASGLQPFHVVEEILWALMAIVLFYQKPTFPEGVMLLLYIAYMAALDVPMYLGRSLRGTGAGLYCIATDVPAWDENAHWMTAYFTAGSVTSLLLKYNFPSVANKWA